MRRIGLTLSTFLLLATAVPTGAPAAATSTAAATAAATAATTATTAGPLCMAYCEFIFQACRAIPGDDLGTCQAWYDGCRDGCRAPLR